MNENFFEKEDTRDDENIFLKILESQDLKDVFILSEILSNPKFDQ